MNQLTCNELKQVSGGEIGDITVSCCTFNAFGVGVEVELFNVVISLDFDEAFSPDQPIMPFL